MSKGAAARQNAEETIVEDLDLSFCCCYFSGLSRSHRMWGGGLGFRELVFPLSLRRGHSFIWMGYLDFCGPPFPHF